MKVTLESTTKLVVLVVDGKSIPVRVWEGKTEKGIPVHAYITRIACHETADASEFERDLVEHRKPSVDVSAIPLRMIL